MPLNGEGDRSVAKNAEVVTIVRVLPDVLSGKNNVLAEGLLDAGVKLIAKAGTQRRQREGRTGK